jgi:hypothetical protein
MEVKLDLRAIAVVLIVVALILGYILVVLKPFTKKTHVTNWTAVAACQKTVKSTYTSLLDEASTFASATTTTIQKQEQSAENNCVTSNTH